MNKWLHFFCNPRQYMLNHFQEIVLVDDDDAEDYVSRI